MRKLIRVLIPLFLLALLIGCAPKEHETAEVGEAPPHIYLNGNYYTLDGRVSVIPDTFCRLGEVTFRTAAQGEMEGNVHGSIYASSKSPHLIYLLPADLEDPDVSEYWIFLLNEQWKPVP